MKDHPLIGKRVTIKQSESSEVEEVSLGLVLAVEMNTSIDMAFPDFHLLIHDCIDTDEGLEGGITTAITRNRWLIIHDMDDDHE